MLHIAGLDTVVAAVMLCKDSSSSRMLNLLRLLLWVLDSSQWLQSACVQSQKQTSYGGRMELNLNMEMGTRVAMVAETTDRSIHRTLRTMIKS